VTGRAVAVVLGLLATSSSSGCGPNPYEARIEGVLLPDAQGVIKMPEGPLVKVKAGEPDPELPDAPLIKLAIERSVPWERVAALIAAIEAKGATAVPLVGVRTSAFGFVLNDELKGPAIQLTSTPDGKFCVGPPGVDEAKCVQSSDKQHINRSFVRETIREAVQAYDLGDVEVWVPADLHWADVVRTIDGARTCCKGVEVRVHLHEG
jgi:hypothetical protein